MMLVHRETPSAWVVMSGCIIAKWSDIPVWATYSLQGVGRGWGWGEGRWVRVVTSGCIMAKCRDIPVCATYSLQGLGGSGWVG